MNHPITVTICELRAHIRRYSGKIVSYRAEINGWRHGTWFTEGGCRIALDEATPEDTDVHESFSSLRDSAWKTVYSTNTNLSSPQELDVYSVSATYVGRLIVPRKGQPGYAFFPPHTSRIILRSISEVDLKLIRPRVSELTGPIIAPALMRSRVEVTGPENL